MKMPFPTHVIVTLDNEGSFSTSLEEFREKIMAALNDFFCEKLEEEPWSDVEATLWYVVQRIILFKEKRMMVKLNNIRHQQVLEGRDRGRRRSEEAELAMLVGQVRRGLSVEAVRSQARGPLPAATSLWPRGWSPGCSTKAMLG